MAVMAWYGGWEWAGWLALGLVMLAFWGLLATGVVALVRSSGRDRRPQDRPLDPSRVLDERLARGELDEDDYRRLRGLVDR